MIPASATFLTQGLGMLILAVMAYVPVFILTPRFIMNMRELYACAPDGGDTGFGISTVAGQAAGRSLIMFAEVGEGSEQENGIQLEERRIQDTGADVGA